MSTLVAVGVGIKIITLWPCGEGDDLTVRCGYPSGDEYGLFCADYRVCLFCMIGVWRCEQHE